MTASLPFSASYEALLPDILSFPSLLLCPSVLTLLLYLYLLILSTLLLYCFTFQPSLSFIPFSSIFLRILHQYFWYVCRDVRWCWSADWPLVLNGHPNQTNPRVHPHWIRRICPRHSWEQMKLYHGTKASHRLSVTFEVVSSYFRQIPQQQLDRVCAAQRPQKQHLPSPEGFPNHCREDGEEGWREELGIHSDREKAQKVWIQ